MEEKIYLFKRAADGVWVYGSNSDCEHPAGACRIAPNTARTEVSIVYLTKSEGNRDRFDVPVTSFYDEAGSPYANFAALKAGYAGFFFRVSGSGSVTGSGFKIVRLVGDGGTDYLAPVDMDIAGDLFALNPSDVEVSALSVLGVDTIRFAIAPIVGDFPLVIYTKK